MTQSDQPADTPDAAEILNSVGEVAYAWRLDTDALTWSGNVAAVLGIEPAEVASGRAFAKRVEADAGQSRAEAVVADAASTTSGARYQIQYAFKRADGKKVWLEDTGHWFAGAAGRCARTASCSRSTRGMRVMTGSSSSPNSIR